MYASKGNCVLGVRSYVDSWKGFLCAWSIRTTMYASKGNCVLGVRSYVDSWKELTRVLVFY